MNPVRFVKELTRKLPLRLEDNALVLDATEDALVLRRDITATSCNVNFARTLQTAHIFPSFVATPESVRMSPRLTIFLTSTVTEGDPPMRLRPNTLSFDDSFGTTCRRADDNCGDLVLPQQTSSRRPTDTLGEKTHPNRTMVLGSTVDYDVRPPQQMVYDESYGLLTKGSGTYPRESTNIEAHIGRASSIATSETIASKQPVPTLRSKFDATPSVVSVKANRAIDEQLESIFDGNEDEQNRALMSLMGASSILKGNDDANTSRAE